MRSLKIWLLNDFKYLLSLRRMRKYLNPKLLINVIKHTLYEILNPNIPWLTKDAINIINGYLKNSDYVIEFGSGMSTPWFATRVNKLVSVEHNLEWYRKIRKLLSRQGLERKVDYRIFEETGEKEGKTKGYVKVIDSFRDNVFDCCLIDGEFRDECALRILRKIKPGGILVVDNINVFIPSRIPSTVLTRRTPKQGAASKYWAKFCLEVKRWRCVWTTNGVWDTAIWFKPN